MSEPKDELVLLRAIAEAAKVVVTDGRETNDWRKEFAIRKTDRDLLWDALAAWYRAFPIKVEGGGD